MKGIILAGGRGSRLFPITLGVSKQLLAVHDKPMIYYPISTLINSGIKDILIISTIQHLPLFKTLLGDGSKLGIRFTYLEQANPNGIAEAFLIGEKFIGNDSVCLILGDNIFYGHDFFNLLHNAKLNAEINGFATIFGYNVINPERYGVIEFDKNSKIISIEEKPKNPKSNYAVSGLYFYPNSVIKIAKKIKPSKRGELEITSVNNYFLSQKKIKLEKISSGNAWLDTGTHDSLTEASHLIRAIEKREGIKIGCIEESSLKMGFISKNQVFELAEELKMTDYGKYLMKIIS